MSGLEARPFDVESSTFIISLHTSVCSYVCTLLSVSLLIEKDYNNLFFRMGIFFWQLTDAKQTQQDWN